VLADQLQQLVRIPGLADDIEPSPLKQARYALAEQDVIIRQDDALA